MDSLSLTRDWVLEHNSRAMNSYTPLFSKIVDSSLWLEDDATCKVFLTMLAKQDRDHVVRGTALAIARWCNKTESEVLIALETLAKPDTKRLEEQDFEGRRIKQVPEGWLLLNGAKYQEMMQQLNRREYKRLKQAEYRKKARDLPGQQTYNRTGIMPHEEGLGPG